MIKQTLILLILLFSVITNVLMAQQKQERQAVQILRKQLNIVEEEEKKALRKQIDNINNLLNNGVIDKLEAEKLKVKAAMASTENIEKRKTALRESIFFLEDKLDVSPRSGAIEIFLDVDSYSKESKGLPLQSPKVNSLLKDHAANATVTQPALPIQNGKVKVPTTVDVVFALGLNNTLNEGTTFQDIEDERDYQFYNSRFLEIGLALKTPLWRKNGFRLKYGISYQLNELEPTGNRIFGVVDGRTQLQDFRRPVAESRFLVHNLVLPVHLEFGPTKLKRAANGRAYYSTSNQFKIGIGGYIGYNLDAEQYVEYPIVIRRRRFTRQLDIPVTNINQQIFGLSGYVGIGAFSIYGKYDLNTIFEDDDLNNEQFISVGVRVDL